MMTLIIRLVCARRLCAAGRPREAEAGRACWPAVVGPKSKLKQAATQVETACRAPRASSSVLLTPRAPGLMNKGPPLEAMHARRAAALHATSVVRLLETRSDRRALRAGGARHLARLRPSHCLYHAPGSPIAPGLHSVNAGTGSEQGEGAHEGRSRPHQGLVAPAHTSIITHHPEPIPP